MKDGLENIDKIFKQAFDGFEANVDPSVWSNVQNSISSGSGGSSSLQVDPSTIVGVGKSLALKIVAGVVIVGTIATTAYFVPNLFKGETSVIAEKVLTNGDLVELTEEVIAPTTEIKNKVSEENSSTSNEETVNLSVEANKAEKQEAVSNNGKTNEVSVINSETSTETSSVDNSSTQTTTKNITSSKPQTEPSIKKEEAVNIDVIINVDRVKGKAPLTVQFDAIGNGIQYLWEFSDDSEEFGESPIHIFSEERTYRVKLTAQDIHGNTKVVYKTIIVEKDYSSSIQPLQNIFTPNGDGENDFIKVRGKNIKGIQVQITDMKGKQVYFMTSMNDVWDGKDQNGNYLPQGQYLMTVFAIGNDGIEHTRNQVVNLLK